MRRSVLWLVPLLTVACGDPDRDGLSNADESELGTDPRKADSDEDGLSDGDERDLGTDPLAADGDADRLIDVHEIEVGTDPAQADSDGDGYADGDEVGEGKDPNDPASVIYVGGWPYQWNKDSLTGGREAGQRWRVGDRVGRLRQEDHHGETVDLYDFALHGRDVILDSSAMWCGPCQATASWLATGSPNAGPEAVRSAVDAGDLYWVTVLAQNNNGGLPTVAQLADWDETFPHPRVPVLKDGGQGMVYYGVNIDGQYEIFPQAVLLDETMTVVARGDMGDVMQAARNRLSE